MKIQNLYESDNRLFEMQVRRGWQLCESMTRDMTPHQRLIVENIYREFTPLIEASLTADQIKSLFGQIEQGSNAAGDNRTMLGKGADLAKKVDDIVNNVGKWLQNTTPVQAFDQKFEKLKNDINKKFPDSKVLDFISELGMAAERNPGATAAIIGVLTAIAGLAGGPIGGAIAGQALRGAVELLKGEKLSTAIGKGIKTAAYGFIAGKTFELIGDVLSGGIKMARDTLVPGAVRANFTKIFDEVGGPLGSRFAKFELKDLVGNPEDVRPITALANQAADAWAEGNYELSRTLWAQVQDGVEVLYTPEYVAQLAADQATREMISGGATAVKGLADFMGAAAQGAIAAGTGGSKDQKKESVYRQTRPLSEGQVYLLFRELERLDEGPMDFLKKAGKAAVGAVKGAAGAVADKVGTAAKNMTTKVTADKLTKAWTKAGSPTDSDELYSFLTDQGVNKDVVTTAYQAMKIAPPKDSGASSPAQDFEPGQEVTYVNAKGQEKTATVVGMLDTKDAQGDPQIQLKSGGATFAVDRDNIQSPGADKQASADDADDNQDQSQQQGGSAAPAGTIGLAQEPGKEQPAQGAGATTDQDTDDTTSRDPAAKPAAGGTPTATASAGGSAVDIYKLAKEIKQMKPEVIAAVKKVLSSKQSQLAK